jgi:hypothetical protein
MIGLLEQLRAIHEAMNPIQYVDSDSNIVRKEGTDPGYSDKKNIKFNPKQDLYTDKMDTNGSGFFQKAK